MEHQTCTGKPQTFHLTTEEITNPFPVIENFFQTWSLSECRSLLREVLHQALSGYSHRHSINPADRRLLSRKTGESYRGDVGYWGEGTRTEPMKTKPSNPTSFLQAGISRP